MQSVVVWSDRRFIIVYSILCVIAAGFLLVESSPWGYVLQILPSIPLLWFWIERTGNKLWLFTLSWIFFALADVSAIYAESFSSLPTSIIATLGLIAMIVGFIDWKDGNLKRRGYLALIVFGYGLGYFHLIYENIPTELFVIIAVYAVLDFFSFVVIAGVRLNNNYAYMLCLFAISTYMVTDAIYAYHFFVEPIGIGESVMSALRFLSQALFVFGIIEEHKTSSLFKVQ